MEKQRKKQPTKSRSVNPAKIFDLENEGKSGAEVPERQKPHKSAKPGQKPGNKPGLHPRSRFGARYNFDLLTQANPDLKSFIVQTETGTQTVDFKNPLAVRALNRAILMEAYSIKKWDMPEGYLCAPIPGRADYIYHIADILAKENNSEIPEGPGVRGLDIGTGSTCIYPIIGHSEYGWSFVGTDIDKVALKSVDQILLANPKLKKAISWRFQPDFHQIFHGIITTGEYFDFTICNPPFHKTMEDAAAGTQRKWKNLGVETGENPLLNFGGQPTELQYPGGELDFIRKMIIESGDFKSQCRWFTTLVAQKESLPPLYRALSRAAVTRTKTIEMAQGQKVSRILAWSFE